MLRWITLNFGRWSGGATNGARWGTKRRRMYWRGRWTPFVVCHFRRITL